MQDRPEQSKIIAETSVASADEAYIIANLWNLYQYDLSEAGDTPINAHGLFEDADVASRDLLDSIRYWWERPNILIPFIIRADGRAAGFGMVGAAPGCAPKGCDYFMHEFFVVREFRGRDIARAATATIFGTLPGRWELRVMLENSRALAFWRAAIKSGNYSSVVETRKYIEVDSQDKIVFQFDTGSHLVS
ncbi:MAG: hypothetical protein JWQ02_2320 [Capsulimonas sp.]|nr:hypothetical protein [Capsulimonas sp.]